MADRRVQIALYYGLALVAGIVSGVLDARSTAANVVALVVLIALGVVASRYRRRALGTGGLGSYFWVGVFVAAWIVTAMIVRGRFP